MENRFEQMPEEQGWRAPLPPRPSYPDKAPPLSGTQNSEVPRTSQSGYMGTHDTLRDNLCAWVRERMSDLLDNDGTVRPEQAAGIYAHMAICRACSQEFEEMQHLVSLVESLPPAELPCDFSPLIMQRIEFQSVVLPQRNLNTALSDLPNHSKLSNDVTAPTTAAVRATVQSPVVASERQVVATTQTVQTSHVQTTQTQSTQTQGLNQGLSTEKLGRLTLGSLFSSGLAYLISSTWGRQMLSVNMTTVGNWFGQLVTLLREVPLLTWMLTLIVSTVAQLNVMVGHTYQTMGTMAVAGLLLDAVICVIAYSVLDVRRRQAQMRLY